MRIYARMMRLDGNHHGPMRNGSGEVLRSTIRLFRLGVQHYDRTNFGLRLYFYRADGSNISFDLGVVFHKPPFANPI